MSDNKPKPEKGIPRGPLKHHPPRDDRPEPTDDDLRKWQEEQGGKRS